MERRRSPLPRAVCAVLAAVLLAGLPARVWAAEPNAGFPLSRFMTRDEPIMLRNARGEYGLTIPIARRVQVRAALLHLEWTNSISLLPGRSQIRVLLGEQVIAQAPLDPRNPEGTLDVNLPPDLLRPGYNALRFSVAQHYTEKCEDPSAPELWTQINPLTSRLVLDAVPRPLQPRLSQFDSLFDPKTLDAAPRLHVVVPVTGSAWNDNHLRSGALVAEGAALRLQYHALAISCGPAPDPALDNILLGTRDELRALLEPGEAERITGAYLAVLPLPGNPARFALVVSGRDAAEVARAAAAFAYATVALPDAPAAVIAAADFARPLPVAPRNQLQSEKSYLLRDLGLRTATVKGVNAGGFRVELNVPADFYSHEDTELLFLLHFAHGAALRSDSVFNVFLNGKYQTAVPIGSGREGVYRNYKIVIPFRGLRPGANTVEFTPQMVPIHSEPCAIIQDENLLFTLFDDSRVVLPAVSRYVTLPDLGLAARCVFPQAAKADGSELAVHVAARDADTVAAAWTLLGKLAQRVGAPLENAEVSFALPKTDRHLLAVGSAETLDPELLRAAPLNLGRPAPQRIPHPLAAAPLRADTYGWVQRLRARFGFANDDESTASVDVPAGPAAWLQESGGLGEYGLTQQFRSPFYGSRVGWIVTAEGAGRLRERVEALVAPALWDSLSGDVALWTADTAALAQAASVPGGMAFPAVTVQSYRLGPPFHLGSINPLVRIEYQFSRHPWLWLGSVAGLLLLFAFLTRLLLRRFKLRHHGNAPEVETHN